MRRPQPLFSPSVFSCSSLAATLPALISGGFPLLPSQPRRETAIKIASLLFAASVLDGSFPIFVLSCSRQPRGFTFGTAVSLCTKILY
ncbi:hypothetical protein RJT34_04963 [Clitoria ternatea]|uniref:Uncharacterized protein n=1 Tax=Clitoria ternatea TaxID=43366 RepID=A0AAN9KQ05_CLITE